MEIKEYPMIRVTHALANDAAKLSVSVWNYLGDRTMSDVLRKVADELGARAAHYELEAAKQEQL